MQCVTSYDGVCVCCGISGLGFLEAELSRWHDNHNSVYVGVVEERLSQAFTSYRHTKEDEYVRRNLTRWV